MSVSPRVPVLHRNGQRQVSDRGQVNQTDTNHATHAEAIPFVIDIIIPTGMFQQLTEAFVKEFPVGQEPVWQSGLDSLNGYWSVAIMYFDCTSWFIPWSLDEPQPSGFRPEFVV